MAIFGEGSSYKVVVYTIHNNTFTFPADTLEAGREYAKRIIMEGLWLSTAEGEVFYPVHQVVKVKVLKD